MITIYSGVFELEKVGANIELNKNETKKKKKKCMIKINNSGYHLRQ